MPSTSQNNNDNNDNVSLHPPPTTATQHNLTIINNNPLSQWLHGIEDDTHTGDNGAPQQRPHLVQPSPRRQSVRYTLDEMLGQVRKSMGSSGSGNSMTTMSGQDRLASMLLSNEQSPPSPLNNHNNHNNSNNDNDDNNRDNLSYFRQEVKRSRERKLSSGRSPRTITTKITNEGEQQQERTNTKLQKLLVATKGSSTTATPSTPTFDTTITVESTIEAIIPTTTQTDTTTTQTIEPTTITETAIATRETTTNIIATKPINYDYKNHSLLLLKQKLKQLSSFRLETSSSTNSTPTTTAPTTITTTSKLLLLDQVLAVDDNSDWMTSSSDGSIIIVDVNSADDMSTNETTEVPHIEEDHHDSHPNESQSHNNNLNGEMDDDMDVDNHHVDDDDDDDEEEVESSDVVSGSMNYVFSTSDTATVMVNSEGSHMSSSPMSNYSVALIAEQIMVTCGSDCDAHELLKPLLEEYVEASTMTKGTASSQMVDSIRDRGHGNCTCMHMAAQQNNVQCMELLLMYGATVDSMDDIRATPLFYAAVSGSSEAATFLLHHGAQANHKDIYNNFPVFLALRNKHFAMIDLFLLYNANLYLKTSRGNCLHRLAESGNLSAIRYLISKHQCSPYRLNDEEQNLLFCGLSHPKIVQYLLRKCDVKKLVSQRNVRKRNVFHECCLNGYFENMIDILSFCVSVIPEEAEALLNDKDTSGTTPLMLACKGKRYNIIRFLSTCTSVNVDAQNNDGNTALHLAIKMKDIEAIQILVTLGNAKIKIKNKMRISCQKMAKQYGIQLPESAAEEDEEEGSAMSFLQLMKEDNLMENLDNGQDSSRSKRITSVSSLETSKPSPSTKSLVKSIMVGNNRPKKEIASPSITSPISSSPSEPSDLECLSFAALMKLENEAHFQTENEQTLTNRRGSARLLLNFKNIANKLLVKEKDNK